MCSAISTINYDIYLQYTDGCMFCLVAVSKGQKSEQIDIEENEQHLNVSKLLTNSQHDTSPS